MKLVNKDNVLPEEDIGLKIQHPETSIKLINKDAPDDVIDIPTSIKKENL